MRTSPGSAGLLLRLRHGCTTLARGVLDRCEAVLGVLTSHPHPATAATKLVVTRARQNQPHIIARHHPFLSAVIPSLTSAHRNRRPQSCQVIRQSGDELHQPSHPSHTVPKATRARSRGAGWHTTTPLFGAKGCGETVRPRGVQGATRHPTLPAERRAFNRVHILIHPKVRVRLPAIRGSLNPYRKSKARGRTRRAWAPMRGTWPRYWTPREFDVVHPAARTVQPRHSDTQTSDCTVWYGPTSVYCLPRVPFFSGDALPHFAKAAGSDGAVRTFMHSGRRTGFSSACGARPTTRRGTPGAPGLADA